MNTMIDSHLDPELLSAYIDDEVSAEERQEVEAHLNTCQECRQELDSLRWTVTLFREMPAVEVPRPLYVREADLAPAEDAESSWLDQLAAFVGTLRVLSYASAVSFALVFLLTVAGVLPTGFRGAGGAAQPAADTTMMQQESAQLESMEMEAEASEDGADDMGIQEEPAADSAETADDDAEIAAAPEPEATQAPEAETVEEPEVAAVEEEREEFADGTADGDAPAETTERAVPQPPSEPESILDRVGLAEWLLLITGLGTLIFGGLARWLPNN